MNDTTETSPDTVAALTEAMVNLMSDDALYETLRLVKDEIAVREEGSFADTIREHLSKLDDHDLDDAIHGGRGVATITFGSGRWDDGWYYTDVATAKLGDGSDVEIDFSSSIVADQLTELSVIRRGDVGLDSHSILVVDMTTGRVAHDNA